MVVRWIHRSRFRVRAQAFARGRAAIPHTNPPLYVDPAWHGSVVVETEGTNEGLADLQERCGGAFPPRAGADPGRRPCRVFRLLRERR